MRNTLYSLLTVLTLLICIPLTSQAQKQSTQNAFETLMEKIRIDFAKNPSIDKTLQLYNETEGSFKDIDYSSIQRTKWPPLTHLERISNFIFAYTNANNPYYEKESLYNKIQKGLEFWHERNPWCHNWWYNQIAEPQCLGVMLIQMRTGKKQLPTELETKILERIQSDGGHPAKWTGANRTDIALHWIYRSCLTQNEKDLRIALDNAYSPLLYTTKEGFQHDNSYFQHGTQLYIGGYGDEIIKGITQIAMYTEGTAYAVPKEKLAILSKFMRETYYRTIRGEYMLFDVLGRGVSRPKNTRKVETKFVKRMIDLDPEHADEYRAIIERLSAKKPASYAQKVNHTHYFRGDYTLHTRPEYTFDIRLSSNRTMRCEYGNGENLKTYFLSDGCTNIVVDGDEYKDIFPTWNWTRIPGITAPQMAKIPLAKKSWEQIGTSTFAGGVSDSIYGTTAYSYCDNYAHINTQAKKAWFFFDNEIVCLGTGIHSSSEYEIFTTINQCLLNDKEIIVASDKKIKNIHKNKEQTIKANWVLHNKIGYVFPEKTSVFLSNKTQSGSWFDINHSSSKKIIEKEVFTIGLNHGKSPVNANYAYIIVPGKQTIKEMRKYNKQKSIDIITNTADLQIVKDSRANIWQMVFYKAGSFNNKDLYIKVDQPCILILKESNKRHMSIHLADPQQAQSVIKVDVRMPRKSNQMQTFDFDFTQSGIYAGATQCKQWKW